MMMNLFENPWEAIHWSPQQERKMYRNWSDYYASKSRLNKAEEYFTKSLEIYSHDPVALFNRSKCKRQLAKINEALRDCEKAKSMDMNNPLIDMELCNTIYELNRFEETKLKLHDGRRKYSGYSSKKFHGLLNAVDGNFEDSIGASYTSFAYENKKGFQKAFESMVSEKYVEKRPLWKILKEEKKCDVLSILEKDITFLPPREIARRDRAFRTFHAHYFQRNYIDVLFLKGIRHDKNFLMSEVYKSSKILGDLPEKCYKNVIQFVNMLHARSPLYNELYFQRKKFFKKYRDNYLYYIQHQTRRNMIAILKTLYILRFSKKIHRLAQFVDDIGAYVSLKTHRIMPWKFEFVNEVYNLLGLAYTDAYKTPHNLLKVPNAQRLQTMLKLPTEVKSGSSPFVFGARSTHADYNTLDPNSIKFKERLANLEKRSHFSEYHIDKAYIWHEFARLHLNQANLEECQHFAKKGMEEARKCKSVLWEFLCTMLALKANAIINKVESCEQLLAKSRFLAKRLNSHKLSEFIKICIECNKVELENKRNTVREGTTTKSKASIRSRPSDETII